MFALNDVIDVLVFWRNRIYRQKFRHSLGSGDLRVMKQGTKESTQRYPLVLPEQNNSLHRLVSSNIHHRPGHTVPLELGGSAAPGSLVLYLQTVGEKALCSSSNLRGGVLMSDKQFIFHRRWVLTNL